MLLAFDIKIRNRIRRKAYNVHNPVQAVGVARGGNALPRHPELRRSSTYFGVERDAMYLPATGFTSFHPRLFTFKTCGLAFEKRFY